MDYVNLKYRPKSDDLVCLFRVEPERGMSVRELAGRVAAESSIGTWTDLTTMPPRVIKKLQARVFDIKGNYVKVAYPVALFEPDNVPQILSSIAGNIFGLKWVRNLRLEDIDFPDSIIQKNKGPAYGIPGIRRLMRVPKRPFVGTIIKPKLGLTAKEHVRVAYEAYCGGCDFVKDDENLSNQRFNPFEDRVIRTLEARDLAESETGERKMYLANVTAETNEMIRRAEFVKDHGGEYIMIDILTSGFAAVQTLRNAGLGVIHAHRAMHGAITRNPKHGISMLAIADVSRLIGVDQLHIGTAVGKMEGGASEVQMIHDKIEKKSVSGSTHKLAEKWGHIKPVLAVCSGGLHPGLIDKLMRLLGNDIVIQMGGGIHGHPMGTEAGAKAGRDAVDAVMHGDSLKHACCSSPELSAALAKWGTK
jgi:ribulose-bisphosphate carboxylase large chain